MRPCCLTGHLHSGTPRGTEIHIGGVPAYLSTPPAGLDARGRAVLIAPDALGFKLVNTRLLADSFSEQGPFVVVVPDIFNGKAAPEWMMDLLLRVIRLRRQRGWWSWLQATALEPVVFAAVIPAMLLFVLRHGSQGARKAPLMEAIIADLKADYGVQKVAVSGYCYGGGCSFALAERGTVDAWATAHTSLDPALLRRLSKPGLLVLADNDFVVPEKVHSECLQVLAARGDDLITHKFYPGTYHGFATRGDEESEVIEAARQDALRSAVAVFNAHL